MILSRLKNAIREQNWFAVVLEVCIVIVGVVIGFQISAWGEARADRDLEQTYLHQLADDLRETERRVTETDSILLPFQYATGALMRAFYAPTRPSRDSLQAWMFGSGNYQAFRAVTGTAEALVATAMGLFAAIPAVIAYNRYTDKVVRLEIRYDGFMEEFSSILQRHSRTQTKVS